MRMMANFLALCMFLLFIVKGEEAEPDTAYAGNFVAEVDFSHTDFPTTLSRSQNTKQVKIPRLLFVPTSLTLGISVLKQVDPINLHHQVDAAHPLICALLKLVVCSNAP